MSFCMFHAAEAGLIVNILDRFVLQCTGSRDCYIVKLTLTHNEYHRKHISVMMFKFEINHLSRCIFFSFSINFQESFVRQKYLLRDSHIVIVEERNFRTCSRKILRMTDTPTITSNLYLS